MRKLESWLLFCATLASGPLAACSGSGGGNQMATTAQETLVGEIRLTGSAPTFLVTLTTAEGRSVDLVGDLRGELQNLSGAEVAVRGTPGSARDIDVVSYAIRAIQGVQSVGRHAGVSRRRVLARCRRIRAVSHPIGGTPSAGGCQDMDSGAGNAGRGVSADIWSDSSQPRVRLSLRSQQ